MSSGNKRGGNPAGSNQSKKPKNEEDDEVPGSFVDHLAGLDDMDDMDEEDFGTDKPEGNNVAGPALKSMYDQWARPPPPPLNPAVDSLTFQQVELDHYIGKASSKMSGVTQGPAPVIRMFGVTMGGNSVCCHVHGFHPYIYVPAPLNLTEDKMGAFRRAMNKALIDDMKSNPFQIVDAVLQCQLVKKSTIYGFQGNKMSNFVKVTLAVPKLIAASKRLLEKGEVRIPEVPGFGSTKAFEANIDFEIRFMADTKVVGCNWIELPAGSWTLRRGSEQTSRSQLEVDVAADKFLSHPPEGDWLKVAPLRILSFDIECAGRKGVFPEPEKDPVIQIASMVVRQGEKEPFIRNVFTLDTCAAIVGSVVISCTQEKEMLQKWASFVRDCDPDILTGYNINNFDLPYLLNRAKTLRVDNFSFLGRIINTPSVVKETVLQSKQMGRRENKSINIEGRVTFDLLLVLIRDYKLRSYTLNAVSYHFLGEQKEDVHHSVISDLQAGNAQTRRRLAVYCLKDAYLPLRLLDKLMCIINAMEMARVTGVPLSYLQTRGQQIKVVSQLLR